MKITYALPMEADIVQAKQFLQKERGQARNIKSDVTRKQVEKGLSRIRLVVEPGTILHWDGESEHLKSESYEGVDKIYHCGREFVQAAPPPKSKYLLVAMDAQECTIGLLNGKRIETLWHEMSDVPRKHNKGGQSKLRFQRNRELALKHWYKKIADKMKDIVMKGE